MEEYLRTYCEIDLKAIRENYINIKKKTGDKAMTMAVIKADGFPRFGKQGHFPHDSGQTAPQVPCSIWRAPFSAPFCRGKDKDTPS